MEFKPCILIVVTSHEYYQSYFDSGFISRIASCFTVSFLVKNTIKNLDYRNFPVQTYSDHPFILQTVFHGVNLRSTKTLSALVPGFALRISRVNFSLGYLRAYGALAGIKCFLSELFAYIASHIYDTSSTSYFAKTVRRSDFIESLVNLKPEVVVIPCMATNLEVFLASWYKKYVDPGAIDVCLVDNWDNLCSKSTFLLPPTALGVYGRQSQSFASRIHGIPDNQVFIWGSPRYAIYQGYESSYSRKDKVLYCGTSCFYDEARDILRYSQAVSEIIENDIKFLHLPHPWRTTPSRYKRKESRFYSNSGIEVFERNGSRNLGDIVSLIDSSWFVISGPTSLILEALLLSKKVIVSIPHTFSSHQHPAKIFFGYEHFFGLELMPMLRVCSEQSDLASVLHWATEEPTGSEIEETRRVLNYFVNTADDAIQNLLNQIKQIRQL